MRRGPAALSERAAGEVGPTGAAESRAAPRIGPRRRSQALLTRSAGAGENALAEGKPRVGRPGPSGAARCAPLPERPFGGRAGRSLGPGAGGAPSPAEPLTDRAPRPQPSPGAEPRSHGPERPGTAPLAAGEPSLAEAHLVHRVPRAAAGQHAAHRRGYVRTGRPPHSPGTSSQGAPLTRARFGKVGEHVLQKYIPQDCLV